MISEEQSSPSSSSSSLKDKLFKSSMCLSGCFSTTVHHEVLENEEKIRTPKSSSPSSSYSSWLKSTAHDLPEIRDRCRNLISRIGKGRRHYNSGEFSYDPSSYALNFEDESRYNDEFPLRDFSSRLPASPSPPYATGSAAVRREIVGFS
ncbi:uncharacterized protein LOC107421138 [Ziziphus jujuba]|uniref:Uncharacterized protein LOC107421138 n=2 Tax=Ziziphus jujuba TaxID=326968 RepID=A0A6P3ZZP3_ZIZJJ|nr:uncharacterized protein LOC107421138 [Ziziphus jujuba]KAH7524587.1 hypothetical protein FEM48_Zijuj06G0135300 [Ziziphus jujuba var. spinosa]